MKEILRFLIDDIKPDRTSIFNNQGAPPIQEPSKKINELFEQAVDIFRQFAEPIGIISEISIARFSAVYKGEDRNAEETPLELIFPKANHLALFAVTLGNKVCDKITEMFNENNFALGWMLDAVASDATERVAGMAEEHFYNVLSMQGQITNPAKILRYSPGYCGWHVSGQKKLFEFLEPEEIGITLRESFLMEPLKSISGVMVAGVPEIHLFEPGYPFCNECRGICRAINKSNKGSQ